MKIIYPVFFTQTETNVLIEVPDLEILTEGKNLSDAIVMARDAIEAWKAGVKTNQILDKGGKIKMQREMDTIQIESRHEIREILKFLEKHYAEVQENSTLKRLYDLLDVMGMDW